MVADHQGREHQIVISRLVHQKADPHGCTFYNVLFPNPVYPVSAKRTDIRVTRSVPIIPLLATKLSVPNS